MAGLPFTKLPVSPEQDMQKEVQSGRQHIQDKFALQWQTVNNNARILGKTKHQLMLRQLHDNAKQEMLEFNQNAQQQMEQLQRVNNISRAGGFTPEKAEELKAGMVYGGDVAGAMYPKEAREKTVPEQLGVLDAYSRLISNEKNNNFREYTPEVKPPSKLAFATPLTGAYSAIRSISQAAKAKKSGVTIQILDRTIPAKDAKGKPILDKYGDPVMGSYRPANEEEKQRYKNLLQKEKDIQMERDRLVAMPDVFARKPGTKGGTFGDKIAASYGKPEVKQQTNNDPFGLFK